MHKVRFLIPIVLFLGSFGTALAQEAFAPEQLYFQGEVIRKVSVGADGIWVIKGADSTGVARLDFEGGVRDYSGSMGLNEPLRGIVGKHGESAIIHTTNKKAFYIDNGLSAPLAQENGINDLRINDLCGTTYYTRLATDKGIFDSYDNNKFLCTPGTESIEYAKAGSNGYHFTDVTRHFDSNYPDSVLTYNFSPNTDGEEPTAHMQKNTR